MGNVMAADDDIILPVRWFFGGNVEKSRSMIGEGKRLLFVLKNMQGAGVLQNVLFRSYLDGTIIKIDTSVPGMDMVKIFTKIEKPARKERRKKIEEYISKYPSPALLCYSWETSPGKYHYQYAPEQFVIMPYFEKVEDAVDPTNPELVSEAMVKYARGGSSETLLYYGTCEMDTETKTIKENDDLSDYDFYPYVDQDVVGAENVSDLSYDDNYNEVCTLLVYDQAIKITNHHWESSATYVRDEGNNLVKTSGQFTSVGSELRTSVGSAQTYQNAVVKGFEANDSAYFYKYTVWTMNYSMSGIETWTVSVPYGDTYNLTRPVTVTEYLVVDGIKGRQEIELFSYEATYPLADDVMFIIDYQVHVYEGDPVYIFSMEQRQYYPVVGPGEMASKMLTGDDGIKYLMVYKGQVYWSELFPRIAPATNSHRITVGNKEWIASGYLRLVEVEEKYTEETKEEEY